MAKNMIITSNGAIFSIDSLVSFTIILVSVLFFTNSLVSYQVRVSENSSRLFLEEKTIFASDSFVKNYDENNWQLGNAIQDFEKKRVLSNQLNTEIREIKEISSNFFVKKISFDKKEIFISDIESENCFSVRRFVYFGDEKGVLEYQGCLNE